LYQLSFPVRHQYSEGSQGITVEVLLRSNDLELRIPAKVDTGAEFCVFSRDIAEALDIVVEAGQLQEMRTLTGVFDTYGHEMSYSTLGHDFTGTLYFAADQEFSRNVLGRRGWLDRLRIGIIDYDRSLLIADYNS
jgi:hypothetical protein